MGVSGKLEMKKAPDDLDRHVGARIKMRRMLTGMSQDKLGSHLGVTFQQVQKYEKCANRIGASRLNQIAKALGVTVAFFYEGSPMTAPAYSGFEDADNASAEMDRSVTEFLGTAEGVQLNQAFARIQPQRVRRKIIDLVIAMADVDKAVKP